MQLNCTQCTGCRLAKAREWAIRCSHEIRMHEHNCSITLTYNNDHLPQDANLDKNHFPEFMRALRQKLNPRIPAYLVIPLLGIKIENPEYKKLGFYMCGEYGDNKGRPHYHAIIFGYDFPDKKDPISRKSKGQTHTTFRQSEVLKSCWKHGFFEIGSATYASAGYIARYIMKKQNGETAKAHYAIYDPRTGEITGLRNPEYTNMSLKPAIGKTWFERYQSDIFPADRCITPDGKVAPVPKYYQALLKQSDPELHETLRLARIEKNRGKQKAREPHKETDNSKKRLAARAQVQEAKLKRLPRNLEK